ncbi:MAG: hypothetical protein IPM14_08605 [bacterium]|nr:hypothetical protein [bacterium]
MRYLPQKIVLALLLVVSALAQSPHGDDFDYDCELCHEPTSWKIDVKKVRFDHSITSFDLVGQHQAADCRSCHSNLEFSKINSDCVSCHTDLHQGTVGKDCSKCHTPKTWMVEDINGLHQKGRFPLVGNHLTADCQSCHTRFVDLYFEPLNTDCFACHEQDYNATQSPNHLAANFSKQCEDCHNVTATSWSTVNIVHDFFPLTGGHAISDCFECHETGGNFTGLSQECITCHEDDYNNQENDPNHIAANFSTDCRQCHTINGWSPSSFDHGLTAFPLTGAHINTECSSCHSSGFTGTPTDCFACHEDDFNSTQDPNHVQSNFPTTCAVCHSTTAWEPATFDHALTAFPLTGKHITVDCQECHSTGYTGTPTDCYSCHQEDYNTTQDPNHVLKGYSTNCTECHTTNGWDEIINFNHSITQFPLTGAHISTDCNQCHQQGYTNTPTDCYLCHTEDYNNSTNPNHAGAGFPTTCIDCHTTTAWVPSTFDHDGQYFPIYTGEHAGEWNLCADCHQVPNNFAVFTCISCHEHNQIEMDDKHQGVQGYLYESNACLSCHPDGTKGNAFNHSNSIFPLTGAHTTLDCLQCHQSGYSGTPTQCLACHQDHYNNTTNPNHTLLSLPTDCEQCHTTNPDWQPATFPIHNQYFELLGAHANITNCTDCHNGNYTTTSNLCNDCHNDAYTNALNPNHAAAGIPTECEQCHTSTAWIPSTFNHISTGFELLGAHTTIQCSNCHQGVITGLNSACISCHQDDFNIAPNHVAQGFPTNCEMCHNSISWNQVTFDHNATNFPLTGAHISVDCSSCHESGFTGTTTICYDCHTSDYQQSTNPSHTALSLPTDCSQCHTTNPDWQPATFPIHNQFFELLGAHANITDCADCHNGNYTNTPNTCIGCHQSEYNGTNDPPHLVLNFSFDCLTCHNMNGWTPANFNHSFYPISGHHNNVNCNQCHSEANYQPQCLSCHMDDFLEEHDPGDPTNCWNCHDTFDWSIGAKVDGLKQLN